MKRVIGCLGTNNSILRKCNLTTMFADRIFYLYFCINEWKTCLIDRSFSPLFHNVQYETNSHILMSLHIDEWFRVLHDCLLLLPLRNG